MELEVGESHTLSFVTGVARSRDEVLDLVRKYREGARITRAFEMAWSHSHVAIRHQQFSLSSIQDFQRLANAIVHNFAHLRAPSEVIKRCRMPQSALWRFGISGDEAIVLVIISDPEQLKFAQELLLAHEYLRQRGVRFDLVLLNDYASGYLQELQNELEFMVKTGFSRNMMDQPGGVYLRSTQQLSGGINLGSTKQNGNFASVGRALASSRQLRRWRMRGRQRKRAGSSRSWARIPPTWCRSRSTPTRRCRSAVRPRLRVPWPRARRTSSGSTCW